MVDRNKRLQYLVNHERSLHPVHPTPYALKLHVLALLSHVQAVDVELAQLVLELVLVSRRQRGRGAALVPHAARRLLLGDEPPRLLCAASA